MLKCWAYKSQVSENTQHQLQSIKLEYLLMEIYIRSQSLVCFTVYIKNVQFLNHVLLKQTQGKACITINVATHNMHQLVVFVYPHRSDLWCRFTWAYDTCILRVTAELRPSNAWMLAFNQVGFITSADHIVQKYWSTTLPKCCRMQSNNSWNRLNFYMN